MLNDRNPVVFIRKVVATVRGIRALEVKFIYIGIIALLGVIVLSLLLQVSLLSHQFVIAEKPAGIVNFSDEKVRLEDNFPEMKQMKTKDDVTHEVTKAKEETAATVAVSDNVVEEWYFDEVYQELRYRKI